MPVAPEATGAQTPQVAVPSRRRPAPTRSPRRVNTFARPVSRLSSFDTGRQLDRLDLNWPDDDVAHGNGRRCCRVLGRPVWQYERHTTLSNNRLQPTEPVQLIRRDDHSGQRPTARPELLTLRGHARAGST